MSGPMAGPVSMPVLDVPERHRFFSDWIPDCEQTSISNGACHVRCPNVLPKSARFYVSMSGVHRTSFLSAGHPIMNRSLSDTGQVLSDDRLPDGAIAHRHGHSIRHLSGLDGRASCAGIDHMNHSCPAKGLQSAATRAASNVFEHLRERSARSRVADSRLSIPSDLHSLFREFTPEIFTRTKLVIGGNVASYRQLPTKF